MGKSYLEIIKEMLGLHKGLIFCILENISYFNQTLMISGHEKKAEGGVWILQFKDFRLLCADDIKYLILC